MSTLFYAGNDRLIGIAKQVDKDTPAAAPTEVWRITGWTKEKPRNLAPLEESDNSAQQGASHVTSFGGGFTCELYMRPSEMDFIAEAVLGDNDDSSTSSPTTHTAVPTPDTSYYTVWEINPDATTKYDGCRATALSAQAQDEGQTEWRLSLTFMALGVTHGGAQPLTDSQLAALLHDELPMLWAETTVEYDGASSGRTSACTININRNSARIQGDNGFRALDIIHGKFQVDGSVTRYLADNDTERAVDTGSESGTVATTDVFKEPLSVLVQRGSGGTLRQVLFTVAEAAYLEHTRVNDYSQGRPVAEVLPFESQPQAALEDNFSIVTVNAKTTTT